MANNAELRIKEENIDADFESSDLPEPQYDEPDLNTSQKTGPKTPTASKVIPLGSRNTKA